MGMNIPLSFGGSLSDDVAKALRTLGVPRRISQTAIAVPHTGSISETILASVTIPGGAVGPSGRVIVNADWTCTVSANNKTPRIRYGGATIGAASTINTTTLTTSHTSFRQTAVVRNRGTASQFSMPTSMTGTGASTGSVITMTYDTASDFYILFTGQLALGTETLTLEGYAVDVVYGA